MFVGAATQQKVVTPEQWIALVTKICHGSAEPESGNPSEKENHWLKYNTVSRGCSFISANWQNPAGLKTLYQWPNHGGRFNLDAWLNAYRSFKKQGALSLVNCYDQAGAVELAASLGVSYKSIVWELCNNPYFKKEPKNKILDPMDVNRRYFANHAFLPWNPTFTPDADTFSEPNNPSIFTGFFAIDACAGPHLGDQERGSWVSPTSYPDSSVYPEGYKSKDTTYWRTRDDKYLLQEHTYQYLGDNKRTWKNLTDRHFWTPGITGLSVKPTDAGFAYLNEDHFTGSAITFPTAADFPDPDGVYAGSISYLEDVFRKHLSVAAAGEGVLSWTEMTIPVVKLGKGGNGGRLYEVKLFDPALPASNFASVKISILPSLDAALIGQKERAAQIIITSTLAASDFTSVLNDPSATPEENQVKIYILQADFTDLIVW
ncbi:hypothetical protein FAVG1_08596 [Fusarium avenaceum]|nr:hypothetical protein FAVG1_08596 [Fusarium avenaceum]